MAKKKNKAKGQEDPMAEVVCFFDESLAIVKMPLYRKTYNLAIVNVTTRHYNPIEEDEDGPGAGETCPARPTDVN